MESKNPHQYVAETLASAVQEAYEVAAAPEVSRSEPRFGDFQTNLAMQLAQELDQSPHDIAQTVTAQLQTVDNIKMAETAGPGFINVSLTEEYWRSYLMNIGGDFGRSDTERKEKVQVEFVSANPTGPLTLGNARGGFIGDVLSNVLDTQGHEVTREYYYNNAGTQISKLLKSVQYYAGETQEEPEYRGEYMQELAQYYQQWRYDSELEMPQMIADLVFQKYIQPALDGMGIGSTFEYTNENELEEQYHQVIAGFQNKDTQLIKGSEGATWLYSGVFGDEREWRVLQKSNGDRTYLANDIAYHWDIFANRGLDKAIKVWGADHAGQVPSLQKTLHYLFPDKSLEFLIVQWVRLIKDGQEFKISKRAGTYVTVDELIERVGADVARWFMLMRSNDTHMDFDLDLAAEQSQKNPFWYVMYAYVRANSIMAEASEQGMEPAEQISQLNAAEREIVKKLSRLPELLEEIAHDYQVHHLTFYGRELAKLFHDWYEKVRVVDLPAEEAAEKLYFLQRFIRCMDAYWRVLGIEPYEKM